MVIIPTITFLTLQATALFFGGRRLSADLGECGGSRGHQDLTHSVVEALHRFIIHTQETLRRPLFGYLHMEIQYENLKTGM